MFMKSLFYAVGTVVVIGGGYAALANAAPTTASAIDGLVHDYLLGWSDSACESNPLGCLDSRFRVLQDLEKRVQRSILAIRGQRDRIAALVDDTETTVAKNSAFLNEGKELYKRTLQPESPIEFAGKSYPNGAVFKQQLALLFQEKAGLEANLANSKALKKKLDERLDGLMSQSGSITLAKRMVPAQIELVRANMALTDFGSNLDMINGVIKGSEVGLDETEQLIRTTKDLMTSDGNLTTPVDVPDEAFEKFLSQ
ncbi:exported hypothetical protein [Mesorhizobium plurifarium]|uniref:Uncharacterized protein n=1 Tax=Mesorhizobium plurifarium TaxID=69974 RepID=A0A0K2VMM8_MESPL|nr:exported hypothetical protein [Mesorhizobium plurifarium]